MTEATSAEGKLGTYELLRPLSRGNQRVWLGRNPRRHGEAELVSIKQARADGGASELALLAEARLTESVQTPHVLQVLALTEERGMRCLIQEWVPGDSLYGVVERSSLRGGISVRIAAAIASQVLAGLEVLHAARDPLSKQPAVHGGISSQTVLLSDTGTVKLLDVGVALTGAALSDAETVPMRGRLASLAPEQVSGRDIDARADLFAVGTLLYWLTTKQHPFKHHGTAAVLDSIFTDSPIPLPSTIVPGYPSALEAVVMRALQRDPNQRWQSARDMREALAAATELPAADATSAVLRAFLDDLSGRRSSAPSHSLTPVPFTLERGATDSRQRPTVVRRGAPRAAKRSQSRSTLVGLALAVAAFCSAAFAGAGYYQAQHGVAVSRMTPRLKVPHAAAPLPTAAAVDPQSKLSGSATQVAVPGAPNEREARDKPLVRSPQGKRPAPKTTPRSKPRDLLTPNWTD